MRSPALHHRQPTYRWYLFPKSGRFPKRWWHWWRLSTVVVLVAAGIGGISWLPSHVTCADGLPSGALWSDDGDCVGVSDDAYDFGLRDFDAALQKISQQNSAVRSGDDGCPQDSTITVAAVVTLASANAGGRSVHEIEGFAAAQAQANAPGCVHPVVVDIANMGSDEQAATDVAQRLKDDSTVVAAVGMGLSLQQSADVADLLGQPPNAVPMVSDVITAEGFDATGSRGKEDDFANCAANYPNGVGGGYFYRVAYNNSTQINDLTRYLVAARPDFILTPTDLSDPYTCTALALVENHFGDQVTPVKFDPSDASTVPVAVQRICSTSHPVTAFYTARSGDLGRFIEDINTAYQNGTCQPASITLLSPSDADRLLAAEPDPGLEAIRQSALTSSIFEQGKLRMIYAPLMDADSPADATQYQQLVKQMTSDGFTTADLADGWAVNAYDSLGTVAQASQTLSALQAVTRGQINSAVSALSTVGAGGHISFDAAGDRTGDSPIQRVCPAPPGKSIFTVSASLDTC